MRRIVIHDLAVLCIVIASIALAASHRNERAIVTGGVEQALADPMLVRAAQMAGYRLEKLDGYRHAAILARCSRSDATGPLPCDRFPEGDYPEIASPYPITIKVQP